MTTPQESAHDALYLLTPGIPSGWESTAPSSRIRYENAYGRKIIALSTASTFVAALALRSGDRQVNQHLFGLGDKLELVNLGILIFAGNALFTVRQPSGMQVHDSHRV